MLWTTVRWALEREEFQKHALSAGDVLMYYAIKSPEFLVLLLPVALLLALLYALSNHARHNEITAMRAAGISLWRLATPYLAVGCVTSGVLFALNEFLVPNADEYAARILRRGQQEKVTGRNLIQNFGFNNARDKRTWQMRTYDVNTTEMTDLQVICNLPDKSARWLYAVRAVHTNGGWTFFNVREFVKPADRNELVPSLQADVLALPEFSETPEAIRSEVRISERLGQVKQGRIGRAEVPIIEIVDFLRFHPDLSRTDSAWLYSVLHGRLAAPWKCIVVVLIALPFGAVTGRRNMFVGVASSLGICFAYYGLQELSLALGTGGYVPPWVGGWLPNLAFGMTGIWMTARVR